MTAMISTFECVAVGAAVLVLWLVAAENVAPDTVMSGLAVALAAACWSCLLAAGEQRSGSPAGGTTEPPREG